MSATLSLPAWIGAIALTVVCVGALLRGGWPERVTAIWLGGSWLIALLVRDVRWTQPQWGSLVLDVAFFAVLLVFGLRSDRFWPLWAAGFQLLAVITHGARIIDPILGDWVYITASIIWTYLVLAALGVGVWGCWRGDLDGAISRERRVRSPPRAG